MSASILKAIEANGWESHAWGGNVIARKGRHQLDISPNRFARWTHPSHGGSDTCMVEGVRGIVSVLNDPDGENV